MTSIVLFFTAQFIVSGYAFRYGGAPERWVGAMLLLAAILTALVPWNYWTSFRHLNVGMLAIDVTLLAGLVVIALLADRFWPLWLAGLHVLGLMAHGLRIADPQLWAITYFLLTGKIAYPIMAVLAIGTFRTYERKRAGGHEWAWTFQRQQAERRVFTDRNCA